MALRWSAGNLELSYSTDMPIRWIGGSARVEALTHSLSIRLILPRYRDSEITPTENRCYLLKELFRQG